MSSRPLTRGAAVSRPIKYDHDHWALKRLKQRIARASYMFDRMTTGRIRREINQCINDWHLAERRKKGQAR